MKAQELIDILDDLTLRMIDALQSEKFDELEALYARRATLMRKLSEFDGSLPEAALSKLLRDSERLMKVMKSSMEKVKGKIEEISKNLEFIQRYAMKEENSQIDERR